MIQSPTTVFLDRDGTIIRDVSYLSHADEVELLPGAADAIARLNKHGTAVIVITNQSGIARGRFTVTDYLLTERRLDQLLLERGAMINATYYCPDHPDFTGPCTCRKPSTLLFERAISDHSLDMTAPAYIGDRWRDLQPSRSLGGTPVLVSGPNTPPEDVQNAVANRVTIVASLADAVSVLLGVEQT
jgi:D-glycero-D-manno-heptose 1,7-bisphosphate phosphatase